MSDLNEVAARGRRMKELSEDKGGLFEVFDAVRANYLETIVTSDPADTAIREATYHRIRALDDIRATMALVISEGAGAEATIQQLTKPQRVRA